MKNGSKLVDVVMPMLGKGTRMNGMQNTIKPLITLKNNSGKPEQAMFLQSLSSLVAYSINNLVLVVPKEYESAFRELIAQEGLPVECNHLHIVAHGYTSNPVQSLRVGLDYVGNNLPVIVLDCDIYAPLPVYEFGDDPQTKAQLFVFNHNLPNKSYIQPLDTEYVKTIKEKKQISNFAVMGAYMFSNGNTLRYYASLRNRLLSDIVRAILRDNYKVSYTIIDHVINYGTEEEYVAAIQEL